MASKKEKRRLKRIILNLGLMENQDYHIPKTNEKYNPEFPYDSQKIATRIGKGGNKSLVETLLMEIDEKKAEIREKYEKELIDYLSFTLCVAEHQIRNIWDCMRSEQSNDYFFKDGWPNYLAIEMDTGVPAKKAQPIIDGKTKLEERLRKLPMKVLLR